MHINTGSSVEVQRHTIFSENLQRDVLIDCYLPPVPLNEEPPRLLLINDGQDLVKMPFDNLLLDLYSRNEIHPLFCVGLHCSADRKNEYGTAGKPDFKGRGAKADLYTRFVQEELLPFLRNNYKLSTFAEMSFAGFSLGGLSAMDIVWNHQEQFRIAGIFSGSFWWRECCQDAPEFDENIHRIMHKQVREGSHHPGQRFFFEVGTQDETADRNQNGVIDAIDDTISLIEELLRKGYKDADIRYLELEDGRHDVPTWARAFPDFLTWGWGR